MVKIDLTKHDFDRCPVWYWDDDLDGYLPVLSYDPLPDDRGNLRVRAVFVAESGERFHGYLIGIVKPFAFELFWGEEAFGFNLNLPDLARGEVSRLRVAVGSSELRLFPVRYYDDVGFVDSPRLSGVIEM